MPSINIDQISDIIRDVAHEKIVPRFEQLKQEEIRQKSGPGDLVTIADEEAEIELTRILKDILPGSHVVGEEAVSSGTVLRDILKDKDNVVWVVDPVDGTGNFANGRPIFGTMVALVKGGERVASWIYQIPRTRMITAEKSGGVKIDEVDFSPPEKPPADLDFKAMSAFIGTKFIPPHMRPFVEKQIAQLGDVTTCTCCAWEYIDVLEGKRTFSFYKRIEPWDHLAGALILSEAGYYTRKWDGEDYGGTDLEGGLLNAPSREIWQRVYDLLLAEPLRAMQQR